MPCWIGWTDKQFGSAVASENKSSKRGVFTVLAVFGGLFLMFMTFALFMLAAVGDEGLNLGGDRIGIVEVVGPITDSKKVVSTLRKYANDDSIKGILVRIDSPGGAVAPSQEMFHAVAAAEAKKPLAVSMGSTAASGGYYTAIGSKMIFANPGSVTGSIGVITQLFNVSRIVDKIDVDIHTIKTGPYKDSGSPFREFDARDETYFNALINDIYSQFVEDVAKARGLEIEKVRELADGRVFTGRQAKEMKLVDELGTFEDAVAWVAKKADIEGEPVLVYPAKEGSVLGELLKDGVQATVAEARHQATPLIEYRYTGPQ